MKTLLIKIAVDFPDDFDAASKYLYSLVDHIGHYTEAEKVSGTVSDGPRCLAQVKHKDGKTYEVVSK